MRAISARVKTPGLELTPPAGGVGRDVGTLMVSIAGPPMRKHVS